MIDRLIAIIVIFGGLAGGLAFSAPPALYRADGFRVVDGDSLALGERRIRLVGFDTPESWRPRCASEALLAAMATERTRMLTATPGARLEMLGQRDAYRRELARLTVGGEDAADILIREGLAHAYRGGRRKGWCG